ncbi:ParB/RepB/Spo0J family partition protein [Streptomyces sp. IBSBF 3010]|uniref:ParB/RepB/Spo0J family partition protein n=1 Tax=Streptomyces sp. IBSBF 3010 TaxID=2903526 RepID=UPI002FDC1CBB
MAANPLPRPKRTSTKPPAAPSKEAAFYRGKDRSGDTVELSLKDLCPNPFNRRAMSGVAELAATIQEVGLLQNIAHIPADIWVAHYPETADNITAANVILFGEHRWRAVQDLDWEVIPSVLMDDKVADARLITLIENLRRAQLSPLEEAEHYEALRSSGLSYEQIAQKVGETAKGAISKGTVWKRVQLLALEPEVQGALRAGTLAVSTAERLQKMSAEDQREAVTLVRGGMRPLEAQAQILARQRQTETESDKVPAAGEPGVSTGNAKPHQQGSVASGKAALKSRKTGKKEQPKPSADQYEQDRRAAAAARDTACQLLVETTDVGDPANSELLLKAMTGALLAPQQQSAAQQRALVWLRRAERHRLDDQNASSYFNAVQDSGDGELQLLAAFTISLAAAELRTAARRHSWGTRETGYLRLLQEHAQYTPDTAWEKKELAVNSTGETE